MEFLVAAVVLVVLLLILGVTPVHIMLGAVCLAELFFLLMTLFFIVSLVLLLMTRKTKGEFLRIEQNEGVGTHAVYQIAEQEYDNTFPAEIMFTDKIYKTGVSVSVWLRKGEKFSLLFDWYSILVIAAGLPVFAALAAALGMFLLEAFPYLSN